MEKTISKWQQLWNDADKIAAKAACLYEEGEVIDDTKNTVSECASWQSYRSVLTSITETITAANMV